MIGTENRFFFVFFAELQLTRSSGWKRQSKAALVTLLLVWNFITSFRWRNQKGDLTSKHILANSNKKVRVVLIQNKGHKSHKRRKGGKGSNRRNRRESHGDLEVAVPNNLLCIRKAQQRSGHSFYAHGPPTTWTRNTYVEVTTTICNAFMHVVHEFSFQQLKSHT